MVERKKKNIVRNEILENEQKVVLIYMPCGMLLQPSIGLSLLKAALVPLGISTKILYLTFPFVKLIGVDPYLQITGQSTRNNLVGEWIFSGTLFNHSCYDVENYIEDILRRKSLGRNHFSKPVSENFIKTVLSVRGKIEVFLDECLHKVASYRPRIIGFSSVFYQHTASLALAKLIKTNFPETFIVFGGANCEGVMGVEILRQFSFVDAVISGEGDIIFPQLVQRVLEGKPLSGIQGVYTDCGSLHANINGKYPNAESVRNMDALPYPDYDDFFDQLEKSRIRIPYSPSILFETSRGCWWGDKMQCTFCGLNSGTMAYRKKSSKRALNELTYLTSKYPVNRIETTDNILNMDYFKDFIPELATRHLGINLFYEVKSNLKKEQVRLLRDSGIIEIQPGIESLSSNILRLMRKGVSALQNIQLLKWCEELGVIPLWDFLFGFSCEPTKEYARMERLIPLLAHLRPPSGTGCVRIERFSPYFENSKQFGFTNIVPYLAYSYIYPFEPEVLSNIAYFFNYSYSSPQDVEEYTKPLLDKINSWVKAYEISELFSVDEGNHLLIWDHRPIATESLIILSGLQRILYTACDGVQNVSRLQKIVEKNIVGKCSREEIKQLLQPILDCHLMVKEGNKYLSLAIPVGTYLPEKEAFEQFQRYIHNMKERTQQETFMAKIKIEDLPNDLKISNDEMKAVVDDMAIDRADRSR